LRPNPHGALQASRLITPAIPMADMVRASLTASKDQNRRGQRFQRTRIHQGLPKSMARQQ
jgi:hypothetical protein